MTEANHAPTGHAPNTPPSPASTDPVKPADGDGRTGGTGAADQAPAGCPKPLHDPDPYSTPPYGEPGPWAPAPPVQHPAAQTTPIPAPTAPWGTAPAATAPASSAPTLHVPAPGVPGPGAPAPGTSAPGAPAPGTPAPGAPAPGTSAADVPALGTAAPGVPAHGTPAPGAPAPAPGSAAPGAPAPGSAAPGAPAPGAPAHGTPAPVTTAPGAPAPGAPAPATSAPGAPTPTPTPTAGAPATPTPLNPQPSPHPPAAPERRYDPWVAAAAEEQVLTPGPLQQTGVRVLTEEQRSRRGRRLLVGWSLVIAVVSGGIGGVAGAWVERARSEGEVRLPQPGRVPAGRAPDSVAGIAARALPSVVTLHVSGTDQADTGTGFVLDTQGHILTNNHVVAPAGARSGAVSVTFSSGDTVKAKIVGRDSGYDLAVVQVHGVRGLTPLPLGNSDDVRVGDPVVAIGSPYDLANTVTSGIISAKERPITAGGEKGDGSDVSYVDALQTDAPINPGNSGGPLLDSRARVIGINSAIRSADGGTDPQSGQAGSIGLGFAIPVNQARRVAEELIDDGRATHPVIGVTLDMAYTGDGARIDSRSAGGGPAVRTGGPGDRAGLAAGDVITEVDGQRVHTAEELIVKIRAHRPGDRLRLTVRRDGTDREIRLRLGAAEQN
ncbi:trypsin-like peptidase domain-containing protein [Streptomyces sp. NPDC007189]|uniref:trypsin-like peptidase domain-containing protein n=1 Tax=Streptomyces sp. NPDC007189 TaxID=3154315 RepID=UPI003456F59B